MIRRLFFLTLFSIVSAFFGPVIAAPLYFEPPTLVDRASPADTLDLERLDDPGRRSSADVEFTVANQPDQPWRRRFERLDPGWSIT